MNVVPSKLRFFYERGVKIRGVIHVGMSWGEEIPDYLAMGANHVIGFEPLSEAFAEAQKLIGDDPRVILWNSALGDKSGIREMTVIKDNEPMAGHPVGTGGSTFLKELNKPQGTPDRLVYGTQLSAIMRFDELLAIEGWDIANYNALVIDVQGMELDVLKGFGYLLRHFDVANIECSRVPVYEGEAPAAEVVAFMNEQGFAAVTPIQEHDDILFQR